MKCPGQDTRYWKGDAVVEVPCPQCGKKEELFKDEPVRTCTDCGHRIVHPNLDVSCAAYCRFAEQCLGGLSPEILAQRRELLKDRVATEMKRYFGPDERRIDHALKVARYAEKIATREQGDVAVVLTAAYLHDIGISEAERKYESTASHFHETEGPPVARDILKRAGVDPELVEKVCEIIARHHHPENHETVEFKAVHDADLLVNLEEENIIASMSRKDAVRFIKTTLLTDSGRALARSILLPKQHASARRKSVSPKTGERRSKP
ncbi:MAG: HD domain-containing protein [Deltaproteobacteria bacterium]|nr:HD domain-containing protein [Deltaproteobacteria bacterium]